MKINYIILILLIVFLSGCESVLSGVDRLDHEQELTKIEQDYENGKISYTEYIRLKRELEENYSVQSNENLIKLK